MPDPIGNRDEWLMGSLALEKKVNCDKLNATWGKGVSTIKVVLPIVINTVFPLNDLNNLYYINFLRH